MRPREPHILMTMVVSLCLGCGDSVASEGSTSETGAEEGGGDNEAENPGPEGLGCDAWEGWWDQAQNSEAHPSLALAAPEATAQVGQWRARAGLDTRPAPAPPPINAEAFRSTLISEAAVLSTGRNLALSWCLGNIFPNPLGPGGAIDEEQDAVNLERYELFRRELERATRTWERHSRMNFIHLVGLDDRRKPSGGTCDTALEHVWFRAQTGGCNTNYQGNTNAGGENEFDPSFGSPENPDGSDRELCIAWQFLDAAKTKVPWYAGHESGHIVGHEHEHVRWDQSPNGESVENNCGDNHPFEPVPADHILTARDPWSVMGYEECRGSVHTDGISPLDMLGAYYTFNWTERRVRDMAPQSGGVARRYWAGDERPGLLWYLPRPDRLLEWRFDAQQPDALAYESVERCLDGEPPPCMLTDSGSHWHPIMGRFAGEPDFCDPEPCDMATQALALDAEALCADASVGRFVATTCDAPIDWLFSNTLRCCCAEQD